LLPNWADPPATHPVIFDPLDGRVIRAAALQTSGAASPSSVDAHSWRHLCISFHLASTELCVAISLFAKRICTTYVSQEILSPFMECQLIALDKNPGVRPIGVCEVVRGIGAKAILSIRREDIKLVAGPLQLCAGQMARVEATIHSVRELLVHDDCDAVLLVDTSNAINSLN